MLYASCRFGFRRFVDKFSTRWEDKILKKIEKLQLKTVKVLGITAYRPIYEKQTFFYKITFKFIIKFKLEYFA